MFSTRKEESRPRQARSGDGVSRDPTQLSLMVRSIVGLVIGNAQGN